MSGVMFGDRDCVYMCWFPGEESPARNLEEVELNDEEWRKVLRQLDIVETAILEMGEDGKLVKTILRKSQRRIEQKVSWEVFKRDGYQCRYCGADGVPLTVDHLVLWEEGGPSIPENLVSACKPCNQTRGSMPYDKWLKSEYYLNLSSGIGGRRPGISAVTDEKNKLLEFSLKSIPRRYSERRTRK
jgi:hypothetical protein